MTILRSHVVSGLIVRDGDAYLMNTDRNRRCRIASGSIRAVAWSPDGEQPFVCNRKAFEHVSPTLRRMRAPSSPVIRPNLHLS
jgi:hypothetical protein